MPELLAGIVVDRIVTVFERVGVIAGLGMPAYVSVRLDPDLVSTGDVVFGTLA
jgi:hypothetical protein